ncbi:Spore germination protein B3 [bioreactor metagenome]|uniref:Spore germination protein B3 n=1 Tax=bioreactor metagenome TaxID=1076179 RepID=A0A645CJ21_9ZZZZ
MDNPDANISLEVFESKTTVEPVYSNGVITMKIHIETEASIGESGPDVNYSDRPGLTALKEAMENFLAQNIIRVITKVQQEFDTDIFGFGQTIYQDLPDIWEQYKDNWDTEFKKLTFDVSCEIKIRNSAQAAKSLGEVK